MHLIVWKIRYVVSFCAGKMSNSLPRGLNIDVTSDENTPLLCFCLSLLGFLSKEHSEEHGVHVSQRQSLCHKQGDKKSLSVLSTAEMPRCWNV